MLEPVNTFVLNNKTVEIYPDQDPENPRDWDNADTMICFHGRYNLGDKHDYRTSDFSGWDAMEQQIVKDHRPVAILPLYLYDHSGLTIATTPFSCPWDSGQIGFVFISRESALRENHSKRVDKKIKTWAERYIKASVEEYDQYLRGDVYGYVIKDKEGNEIDSCWGFYGWEAAREAAKEVVSAEENELVPA